MRATAIRLLLALMLLLAGSARALAPVPNETGYLTDLTGIIEPAMIGQIQLRLAQYHIQQQRKISVLLVQATLSIAAAIIAEASHPRIIEAAKRDAYTPPRGNHRQRAQREGR